MSEGLLSTKLSSSPTAGGREREEGRKLKGEHARTRGAHENATPRNRLNQRLNEEPERGRGAARLGRRLGHSGYSSALQKVLYPLEKAGLRARPVEDASLWSPLLSPC